MIYNASRACRTVLCARPLFTFSNISCAVWELEGGARERVCTLQLTLYYYIGSDANAHHPYWGSTNLNPRWHSLMTMSFLSSNNLDCLNDGSMTYRNAIRSEAIDVTVSNRLASGLVSNWQCSSSPSLSDHELITFKVDIPLPPPSPPEPHRSRIRMTNDSPLFLDHLEDELRPISRILTAHCHNTSDLNDMAELFNKAIHRADSKCNSHHKKSRQTVRKHRFSHWPVCS